VLVAVKRAVIGGQEGARDGEQQRGGWRKREGLDQWGSTKGVVLGAAVRGSLDGGVRRERGTQNRNIISKNRSERQEGKAPGTDRETVYPVSRYYAQEGGKSTDMTLKGATSEWQDAVAGTCLIVKTAESVYRGPTGGSVGGNAHET